MTRPLTRIDGKLVPMESRHNPNNNAILRWMKHYKPAHAKARRLTRPARPYWKIRKRRAVAQHTMMLTLRKAKRRMKTVLKKVTQKATGQVANYVRRGR